MRVRKLAVALALAGGLGSGLAQALGMGEGRILTNLNEPLRAQIELSEPGDLSADQIQVSLAPESDFERAGLRRMDVLRDLTFELVETDGGYRINVTSEGPIREPFLSFLVEVTWPNGRLLREYSFLVDPPSRNGGQQTVASDAGTGDGRAREREETQQTSAASSETAAPREYGPTGAEDTLWGIAGEVSSSSDLSRHQVMLAIQEANPDAFANNNINQLRRGRVLRIPSEEAMRSRSKQEAYQQVKAQNQRHQKASQRRAQAASAPSASESDETAAQSSSSERKASSGPESGSEGGGEDELRILTAEGEQQNGDGTVAGMGDGEGDERLTAALEELDRAERDREELSSRLKDLEKQLKTMKELIELKDDQLAEMEQKLAEAREKDQASGDTASTEETKEPDSSDSDVTMAGSQQSGDTGAAGKDEGDSGDGDAPTTEQGSENAQDQEASEVTDAAGTAAESKSEESKPEAAAEGESKPDKSATKASGEDDHEETETAAAAASGNEPDGGDGAAQPAPEPTTQEQGAPSSLSGVFQRVINDPRYQIGAGVLGLGLLGLLWGLARRNAAREQAFYEQLRDVQETSEAPVESSEEVLDLGSSPDEEAPTEKEDGEDALAEADVYLAYGRQEQAARHLEQAIATEPGRKDLRLKLLGIYAETGESEHFEKQYRELSELGDEAAIQQADELRGQLDSAGEQDVSIEDLTEQLKTSAMETGNEGESASEVDSLEDEAFDFSALEDADDLLSESGDLETGEGSSGSGEEQSPDLDDYSIDFELGEDEKPSQSSQAEHTEADSGKASETTQTEEDVADLGFSVDDLELDESGDEAVPELDAELAEQEPEGAAAETGDESATETADAEGEADTDLTLDDLDIDMDVGSAEPASESTEAPEQASTEVPSDSDFDDSFLEELDAELDRVTGEESESEEAAESTTAVSEESAESAASDDELDDLSLDVSDEDLELAEEVAQEGVGEEPEQPEQPAEQTEKAPADQLEEGLMDSELEDIGAEGELSDEELAALEGEQEQAPGAQQKDETDAMDAGNETSSSSSSDEEFDFLEGTDEAGTKLDLARAYVEMGDADGARDILEEVAREGSDEQQQEAQRLLSEL
ncbi:FimV/HubP family polar landmark protein [Halomonadaceae bacterium KBTZ08]